MILSCGALQYGCLDTLNIKIRLKMAEIIFYFHFWPPGRQWRYLQMILSCRALRYGCLDTLNIKSVHYFRRYRQSQERATIPEESDRRSRIGGVGSDRNTVVLEDRIDNWFIGTVFIICMVDLDRLSWWPLNGIIIGGRRGDMFWLSSGHSSIMDECFG